MGKRKGGDGDGRMKRKKRVGGNSSMKLTAPCYPFTDTGLGCLMDKTSGESISTRDLSSIYFFYGRCFHLSARFSCPGQSDGWVFRALIKQTKKESIVNTELLLGTAAE